MWPFKKKHKEDETPQHSPSPESIFDTVICIPGNWSTREAFILSIVSASEGEYMAAGNMLMNTKSKRYYTIEFCDRDERMQAAFKSAGMVTRISESAIEEIGQHTYVIYLSGQAGGLEEATHMAFAATAVLNTGGLGIKIETTGKAFEKNKWLQLITSFETSTLYQLFVIDSIVDDDGTVYSCGMHNLGLKDTIVTGLAFQESVDLISIFGYYQIVDKPTITANQTFSADVDAPVFRITTELNQPNKGYELFENPFGMWRLTAL